MSGSRRRAPPAGRGPRTPRASETAEPSGIMPSRSLLTELKSFKLNAASTGAVNAADRVSQLRIPVPWLGSVNVWLLEGDPLTLVDTGPSNATAAAALDEELARQVTRSRTSSSPPHAPSPRSLRPGRRRSASVRRAGRCASRGGGVGPRLPQRACRRAPLHRAAAAAHGVRRADRGDRAVLRVHLSRKRGLHDRRRAR